MPLCNRMSGGFRVGCDRWIGLTACASVSCSAPQKLVRVLPPSYTSVSAVLVVLPRPPPHRVTTDG